MLKKVMTAAFLTAITTTAGVALAKKTDQTWNRSEQANRIRTNLNSAVYHLGLQNVPAYDTRNKRTAGPWLDFTGNAPVPDGLIEASLTLLTVQSPQYIVTYDPQAATTNGSSHTYPGIWYPNPVHVYCTDAGQCAGYGIHQNDHGDTVVIMCDENGCITIIIAGGTPPPSNQQN